MTFSKHSFTDCHALADALSSQIADDLRKSIAERGTALVALSGGNTPRHLFKRLSHIALDWSKVTVTLVDERWSPESDERSNGRMLRSSLLQNQAAAAQFVPLYNGAPSADEGLAATRERTKDLALPFDAVVLGMGGDGHTASFFPGGDHLAQALDLDGDERIITMRAPGAGEARITWTLAALLNTRALYLHIEGEEKRHVLADAQLGLGEAAHFPVRAVLEQTRTPLSVYWCP